MRKASGWLTATMLVAMSGIALAQEVRDPARRPAEEGAPAARRPIAGGEASASDKELAAVMLACCRNQAELAKLGQQKASSPEVKQFAAEMAREAAEGCAKLEQLAGGRAAARPAAPSRGALDRRAPGTTVPDVPEAAPREGADVDIRVQPGARPGAAVSVRGGEGNDLDWVKIHQEIAAQCLASAKKELSQKEGAEFDKCFMGMALAGIQGEIDAENVFVKYASEPFRAEIQKCLQKDATHLQEAKTVMKGLEGDTPRTARPPKR